MYKINTGIEINGSPEQVWTVLTDFALYPSWNPFIRAVTGTPEAGNLLRIRVQSGLRRMSFCSTVLLAKPPYELRWVGHLLIPGLFDGEHSCRIEPLSDNAVYFHQDESFRGIMSPFIRYALEKFTQEGFHEMNCALKQRVEALGTYFSKENLSPLAELSAK